MDLMSQANEAFDKNDNNKAMSLLNELIKNDPTNIEALHLKGYILFQSQDIQSALDIFQELEHHPQVKTEQLFHLANLLSIVKSHDKALAIYQKIEKLDPSDADVNLQMGHIYQESREFEKAQSAYEKSLKKSPKNPSVLFALGALYGQTSKFKMSLDIFQRLTKEIPNHPDILLQVGIAHLNLGQLLKAQSSFEQVLELNPTSGLAQSNIGTTFYLQGEYVDAINAYKLAMNLLPDEASSYQNLGLAFYQIKRYKEALFYFDKSMNLAPKSTLVYFELGESLYYLNKHIFAKKYLIEFLARAEPDSLLAFKAHIILGQISLHSSETEEAKTHFKKAYQYLETDWAKIAEATALPPIYKNIEGIDISRNHYEAQLETLLSKSLEYSEQLLDPHSYFLTYQGKNDKSLQVLLAQVYEKMLAGISYNQPCHEPEKNKPFKMGVISEYLHKHSVSRYFKSVIEACSKDTDIELYLLLPSQCPKDEWTLTFIEQSQKVIHLSESIQDAQDEILDEELDLLCYLDLGMSPWTMQLAASRLAPIQTLLAGHPTTSGFKQIDYFISCEIFESKDAQDHYSEKLILLPGLGVLYEKEPESKVKPDLVELGLDTTSNNYVCPMLIFKCHPDFDPILKGILEADSNAIIYFFEPPKPTSHYQLIAPLKMRWEETLGLLSDRVKFLPWANREVFYNTLIKADVLLDTPHFSGINTAYLALQSTTPMITMPQPYLKSRWTAGLYKWIDKEDLIAENADDYIKKAVLYASDKVKQRECRQYLKNAQPQLFNDADAPKVFSNCFKNLIHHFQP